VIIAIDASRTTVARPTGTEVYARELIAHLIRRNEALPAPHTLHLCFRDAPPQGLFTASPWVRQHVLPMRRLWTHLRFAAFIRQARPDVTFVPAHSLPFVFPGPAVVTVHDLGYRHYPGAHTRWQVIRLNITTTTSARRATRVLVDSRATADDLQKMVAVDPARIRVAYPGVDAPAVTAPDRLRDRYPLPARYFLMLGTLQPRKNIARLVAAYAQLRADPAQPEIGLVLAGQPGWRFDSAWLQGEGVTHLGYIPEADKGALIAGATALVFPSLYEGFGFPVVEAMHCGTPVITSTTSSLPELAAGAALLVDPQDTGAITAAMQRIVQDQALRETLVAAGTARARQFTWDETARIALATLEEAGGDIG
jgi:glycosyltransferase involved in cell wall biosynthesis